MQSYEILVYSTSYDSVCIYTKEMHGHTEGIYVISARSSLSNLGSNRPVIGLDGYLGMVTLQPQTSNPFQLLDGFVNSAQGHFDGAKAGLPRRLEVLPDIVEEDDVLGLYPSPPAQPPTPLRQGVSPRKLVHLLHRELVNLGVRFPHADVRRRDEDVKHPPHGVVEEVFQVQLVALGEDDGVAQGREDVVPALPELLQRREHPRVRLAAGVHHLVEQQLAVDDGEGRDLPGEPGVLGLLPPVELPPAVLVMQVLVETPEEAGVEGDVASLQLVPCAVGRRLGD